MPATYHPDLRLGVIRLSGDVDAAILEASVRALFGGEAWESGANVLYDCREITSLDLPPEAVDTMVALLAEYRQRIGAGRSAVVGHEPDVLASTALIRTLYLRSAPADAPPRAVEVFTDRSAALHWLGVDALPEEAG